MEISSRKKDHIQISVTQSACQNQLDQIRIIPNSLPKVQDLDSISINTNIGELHLSSPIVINAITGGFDEAYIINRDLASVAKKYQLAIAVGSQKAGLVKKELRKTYEVVRDTHPEGIVIANIGMDCKCDAAMEAIRMIDANALQYHLNLPQELMMLEGDRSFVAIQKELTKIIEHSPVPVIIKEVGFGMSKECLSELFQLGARIFDLGGRGGTNFIKLENERQGSHQSIFDNWGLSLAESLFEFRALQSKEQNTFAIATGGINNGFEIVKSLMLGASATGIAGHFLKKYVLESREELEKEIDKILSDIKIAMALMGVHNIHDLKTVPFIVEKELRTYCLDRKLL